MSISVLVAGDYSPKDRVAKKIDNSEYEYLFGSVKQVTAAMDYSIVNFETTIVEGIDATPIEKCGPNLFCSSKAIDAIKYAGFNCVTLANNHFADFGDFGVKQSLDLLKEKQIDYVGGGMSIYDAVRILYKKINGQKLAVLNFCEEEFTIATKENGGSAPLDWSYVVPKVVEARKNSDYILFIVHGGKEFFNLPTPRMKRAYRALIDLGVDVVVNHHQHCYGGYEVYKEKPIFYGLGNFCFDFRNKKNDPWNEGYMVKLSFDDVISFEIIPYYQCNGDATIELMDEAQKKALLEKVHELNVIIADDTQLEREYKKFSESFFRAMRMSLTPYSNRYLYSLCLRHLLPGFITKERKLILTDYVNCESWRDIFLQYLKSEQR
jgi:poly-gamma-glutamate synthesis protein (capsule biosynthesis protein)